MSATILIGDCRERLKELADASVDSVVCDPPYHLTGLPSGTLGLKTSVDGRPGRKQGQRIAASKGFMGQTWDGGDVAFQPETWAEVLRVLKPGGMLVAFSGCRTYHRMTSAIEDAGFEIREMLSWNFGSGFPKSRNVFKDLQDSGNACTCHKTKLSSHYVSDENVQRLREAMDAKDALSGNAQQDVRAEVRGSINLAAEGGDALSAQSQGDGAVQRVRGAGDKIALIHCEGEAADVQQPVQRQGEGAAPGSLLGQHEGSEEGAAIRGGKPSLEGRRLPEAGSRQLSGREVSESAGMGAADGSQGRLHNAASPSDGADVRLPADANGSGEPQGSQPGEQSPVEPGAVADERGSQAWGGWPVCGGCRKPIIPEGLGTALKPAHEPICLARKPLIGSVASNVLAHGTGALNIDATRIDSGADYHDLDVTQGGDHFSIGSEAKTRGTKFQPAQGRWPANLCHDGSDEVLAGFPAETGNGYRANPSTQSGSAFHGNAGAGERGINDSGSAARFFYCAKATSEERGEGNNHPTVKPNALMRWLVRLVTPPGGTVLDPFMGSGSTLIAADAEQFNAIGIEMSPEYAAIAERRIRDAAGMFADVKVAA